MSYLAALLIFLLITTVIWFVAVAVYRALAGGLDLSHSPNFVVASCVSILLVTLLSLVPFPAGYLLSLGVWWLASKNLLELPLSRAAILFLVLAALSFLSRLAILGALSL